MRPPLSPPKNGAGNTNLSSKAPLPSTIHDMNLDHTRTRT